MKVESYATVHQLVSTIKGELRENMNAVDAMMGCFPPGSMTGAPKLRSMEILETLEEMPRGAYSGSFGYLSVTGSSQFNVIIRSAIFDLQSCSVSVGAGGAIISLSSPEGEWDEMLLKSNSVLKTLNDFYSSNQ
jgi:para-aminobenzoate synthetase